MWLADIVVIDNTFLYLNLAGLIAYFSYIHISFCLCGMLVGYLY